MPPLWMGGSLPLGYAPDGRSLRIVEEDAQIVRQLFDLYEKHGTIMEVKPQTERLGLRLTPASGSGRLCRATNRNQPGMAVPSCLSPAARSITF